MPERLQHFGTPCYLPEPELVGDCQACGGEIYGYELAQCGTCDGGQIHEGCKRICAFCNHEGCKACMIYNDELMESFCGSECESEYLEERR